MICPCKNCVSKGCGEAHDACEKYKAWKHARALAAARRDAEGRAIGRDIPLHVSRFFPRFHMQDRPATDVARVYRLADVAREQLRYVYTGNC